MKNETKNISLDNSADDGKDVVVDEEEETTLELSTNDGNDSLSAEDLGKERVSVLATAARSILASSDHPSSDLGKKRVSVLATAVSAGSILTLPDHPSSSSSLLAGKNARVSRLTSPPPTAAASHTENLSATQEQDDETEFIGSALLETRSKYDNTTNQQAITVPTMTVSSRPGAIPVPGMGTVLQEEEEEVNYNGDREPDREQGINQVKNEPQDHEMDLIQAVVVDDGDIERQMEEMKNTIMGQAAKAEVVEDDQTSSRKTACMLRGGFVLIVIASALLLGLLLPSRDDDTGRIVPAPPVLRSNEEYLVQLLAPDISSLEVLKNETTAQYKALHWLANNDAFIWNAQNETFVWNLQNETEQRVLDRYVMATFYYATNGPWWSNIGHVFLSNTSICEWWPPTIDNPNGVGCGTDGHVDRIRFGGTYIRCKRTPRMKMNPYILTFCVAIFMLIIKLKRF